MIRTVRMLSSLKRRCIEMLGGFPDIESAIDSIKDAKDREYVLTRAVKKHFNTIGEDDILRIHESGHWMFQGKPLIKGEKELLIAEAMSFMETRLWKVLQNDIKWQANRKMFLLAKDGFDLTAGKLWIYILDAMSTRLHSMSRGHAMLNDRQK